MLVNVDNTLMNPDGFLSILAGTNAAGTGRHLANLAGAPSVTESDEMVNPFEDLYGRTAPVVGEDQVQSSTTQVSFEIVELSLKNIQMIRPDMQFTQLTKTEGTVTTPYGVSMKRSLSLDNNSYLNNFVAVYSTSNLTIGGAVILRKARNVSEDREYSFSDDMSVFGIEVTMQAFSEASTMDAKTGVILPNVEEQTYSETAVPTALNA